MLKIVKAASFAAISASLFVAAIGSDAGYALGFGGSDTVLKNDTIMVDPAAIAADQDQIAIAKSNQSKTFLSSDGQVIFTPGTGKAAIQTAATEEKTASSAANDANGESSDAPKISQSAGSLAELVRLQDTSGALDAQAHCLAGAVYFESKGESLSGQLAVARVVMARAKSGRFASSLCGVVFQKSQFSFVRGGRMPAIDTGGKNWHNAVAITKIALGGAWKSNVEGALYFHARYVSPGWRLTRLGAIDNHIFYR